MQAHVAPQPFDAAALALYRHAAFLERSAAELRSAARELVLALGQADPGAATGSAAGRSQTLAVARDGRAYVEHVDARTLGAVSRKRSPRAPVLTRAECEFLERGNEELQAAALYGPRAAPQS